MAFHEKSSLSPTEKNPKQIKSSDPSLFKGTEVARQVLVTHTVSCSISRTITNWFHSDAAVRADTEQDVIF